jgi:general secretion pathway protein G
VRLRRNADHCHLRSRILISPVMDRSPRNAGFTLVEILVVVFIIGLLATIVGVNVMGQTDTARRTKAMADLKQIEQGLNLYKLDNGRFPTTEQGIAALIQKPGSGPQPRKWNPEGYLNQSRVPLDPWGNPYVYLSNGRQYTLRSLGDDGEPGGEGPAADLDSRDLSS